MASGRCRQFTEVASEVINDAGMIDRESSSSATVHIVIVGAGVAGLTCARRLTHLFKKRPHRITVLEARDRIGGRTCSIPEHNLDLGASWIFSHHTTVRSLARELNINTIDQYETGVSLVDTGSAGIERTVMHGIHGGAQRLRGGTGSLCAAMLAELTTENDAVVTVQLSSPVTAIEYKSNETIAVTLLDDRSILADYVVLAIPPKLLTSTIQLTPALPPSLTRHLHECVTWMASTCKAILLYERAWWRDQKLSGFAVSRRSKAQEWHDASSDTCNALFVFCVAGTTKEQVVDATVRIFGTDARSPTAVYMVDWSSEVFTSLSTTDGRGGHPHMSDTCRQPQWNRRLWLCSSEMSDIDGGFLEGAVRRGIQVADQLVTLVAASHIGTLN